MVDTGATVIALTERDAAMLGIHPAEQRIHRHDQDRERHGAGRAGPAQHGRGRRSHGRNVAAMVMPDGALSENLLGLSFLSRLRRFEYSDGKLVLEQ